MHEILFMLLTDTDGVDRYIFIHTNTISVHSMHINKSDVSALEERASENDLESKQQDLVSL